MHQTETRTRSPEQIVAEARQIRAQFVEAGKRPRSPHAVARLLELAEESGLNMVEFAQRTGFPSATLYLWRCGKTSSAKPWPALAAVLAERKGRALAALANEQIARPAPTPESKVVGGPKPPRHAPPTRPVPALARRVPRWLDVGDREHETREAAEAASLRALAERAAAALVDALRPTVDAVDALLAHPDLVIGLADALRTARASRPTH